MMIEDIKKVIADVLQTEASEISDDSHLYDDLGVDSLMGLEILVMLEEEFGIEIEEEQLDQLITPIEIEKIIGSIVAVA